MGMFTDWLHDAIEVGSHCSAKACIKLGANVNQADKFGSPPLWHAILKEDHAFVILLFKHKANPNNSYTYIDGSNRTLIQGCVSSLDRSLVQLFVLQGAKTDSLIYSLESREMKEVVTQAEQYYQKLLRIRGELADKPDNLWAYRELKTFWAQLAAQETNKSIRLYYKEQEQQTIQAIEKCDQSKKSSFASSHRLSLAAKQEETVPLLTTIQQQSLAVASSPHLKVA